MSIAKKSETGKSNSYAADSLLDMAGKMGQWICEAAAEGRAFHEFESEWHEMIHHMAYLGTVLFISQQGDGDLGETVTTDEGVTLQRSRQQHEDRRMNCRSYSPAFILLSALNSKTGTNHERQICCADAANAV